jgi:hypothetical protein
MTLDQQQRLYDTLKEITQYQDPERLRKTSEKQFGLEYQECLEMSYENVISAAKAAIRGVRRPTEEKP